MQAPLKQHWENIYQTKQPNEVSWTEEIPNVSLGFIHQFNLPKDAKIIDIGGGDSKLVDHLLAEGYSNVSVLDISAAAIERAKKRLGEKATTVKWFETDILEFKPNDTYDLWHDRAAFHFQTEPDKIDGYLNLVKDAVTGKIIVGTFSVDGPKKCSGLEIKQYDEVGMKDKFEHASFKNIECKREDHITPSGAVQNFVFCSFEKRVC
jgi:trans-aconitate methyltransferase